jgi:hypothetical protein
MSETNPIQSAQLLLSKGVELHHEHRYEEALAASVQAFEVAPTDSSEKGRAARDASFRCGILGRTAASETWASSAFDIHDKILQNQQPQTREAYRERSASALSVALTGLRKSIAYERERLMVWVILLSFRF